MPEQVVQANKDEYSFVRGVPLKNEYLIDLINKHGRGTRAIPDVGYSVNSNYLDQILRMVRLEQRMPYAKFLEVETERYIAEPVKIESAVFPMFEVDVFSDAYEITRKDWDSLDRQQQDIWLEQARPTIMRLKWLWLVQPKIFTGFSL